MIFVYTFSGWTEALPTKQETTSMVTKKLLEPKVWASSDDRVQVSQQLASIGNFIVHMDPRAQDR